MGLVCSQLKEKGGFFGQELIDVNLAVFLTWFMVLRRTIGGLWRTIGGLWRSIGGVWRTIGGIWRTIGER